MSKIKINPDSLKPRKEWKRHKVKEGNNVFRFLPPFGESSNGYPYRKWTIIWGLLDPESGKKRPYTSSFATEKRCPIVEYVEALTEKAKRIEAKLKEAGQPEDAIRKRLSALNKIIGEVRPKNVYVWNAVDKSGAIGLIELKSTAHKKLKSLMNEYLNAYMQDPTSVNSDEDDSGVWFNIKRTGVDFSTEYDVEKVQLKQKINGQIVFVDDRSALPENIVAGWEDAAYDLSSIYQIKTYDELKETLLANMASFIERCSDARVEGFEPKNSIAVEEEETESSVVHTKRPNSKVTARFDDEDDDGDEVGLVPTDDADLIEMAKKMMEL